ncbi:hypothetical protein PENTCL1PPCAC_8605, partial [Pristionchus entomophagus]
SITPLRFAPTTMKQSKQTQNNETTKNGKRCLRLTGSAKSSKKIKLEEDKIRHEELTNKQREREDRARRMKEEIIEMEKSIIDERFKKDFTVCGILGIGGFGCVFEVEHRVDKCKYAVKRIPVDINKIHAGLKEVRAMALLEHPSIVRYHCPWIEKASVGGQHEDDMNMLMELEKKSDKPITEKERNERRDYFLKQRYNADSAFVYIQMQLCKKSLTKWLSANMDANLRGNFPTMSWFNQLVQGVKHIHTKNLIHRDLKPDNILFNDGDCIKVADMGIAIERSIVDGVEITVGHDGTGSPHYKSPEQASWLLKGDRGKSRGGAKAERDDRSDVLLLSSFDVVSIGDRNTSGITASQEIFSLSVDRSLVPSMTNSISSSFVRMGVRT